jgi:hypothetical protein
MYWKRQFPYAENNKWSQDLDEKRRWTEALERRGPKRVEAELSSLSRGSSACERIGEARNVQVGFIRDWLTWREEHQINWTMLGVISGFVVGIAAIAASRWMN